MITPVSIYATATGEILRLDYMVDTTPPTMVTGESYVDDHWDAATQYVVSGVVTDRPLIDETLHDGETYSIGPSETLTFTAVNGTWVSDDDTGLTSLTSGTESIQVSGAIDIEFSLFIDPPFPYQSAEITVMIYAD